MMTPVFSSLVERACEISAEWHDRTYRKSRWREPWFASTGDDDFPRVPVISHLATVAMTVQRAGWEEEVVAAAFLHDVLEDRNRFGDHMAEATLRTLMGDEVAGIVAGVTEPQFDGDGLPLPWRVRKEVYLDRLGEAPLGSIAVSLADKAHNAWTMWQSLAAGFDIFVPAKGRRALSAGPVEQVWFYESVLDTSRASDDPRLLPMREELRDLVARFAEIAGVR